LTKTQTKTEPTNSYTR